jgi:hypothetical protein
MDRQNAAELLAQSLMIGDALNNMLEILTRIEPSQSSETLSESIGLVMGHNAEVILKIRNLHPDLHPLFATL